MVPSVTSVHVTLLNVANTLLHSFPGKHQRVVRHLLSRRSNSAGGATNRGLATAGCFYLSTHREGGQRRRWRCSKSSARWNQPGLCDRCRVMPPSRRLGAFVGFCSWTPSPSHAPDICSNRDTLLFLNHTKGDGVVDFKLGLQLRNTVQQ